MKSTAALAVVIVRAWTVEAEVSDAKLVCYFFLVFSCFWLQAWLAGLAAARSSQLKLAALESFGLEQGLSRLPELFGLELVACSLTCLLFSGWVGLSLLTRILGFLAICWSIA